MTKQILDRIEGSVYKAALERKRAERKRLEAAGLVNDAQDMKCNVSGYVQALRDVGIINDRERQALYIYYGTI